MRFTYFGHSCFQIEVNNKILLFDPFIGGNPNAGEIKINELKPNYILISHGHGDHIADAVAIAKQSNATVISNFEICNWLQPQGVADCVGMNIGGKKQFDDFAVKCAVAHHSSVLPDGKNGGNPMGFVVNTKEGDFYYAGDTALTLDMQLIPKWAKLKFAILPIGDHFTMGYEDALEAAKMLDCKKIIGVHFDTFPPIAIEHQTVKKAFTEAGIEIFLPQMGETINL